MSDDDSGNPVLAPWTGSHGGSPPLADIRPEHFAGALARSMADYRSELAAIVGQPVAPTFANTLGAMERAGQGFRRATALLSVFTSTLNDAAMQAVQREWAPKLAAFGDEIAHDRALFERIERVFEASETAGLDDEQKRLALVYHQHFVRSGAALDDASKHRLAQINQRLASLYTTFTQNVLADEEGQALILESAADLAGLPDEMVSAAALAAEARGRPGRWAIVNTRSSMEPFITFSARRDLRQRALALWSRRGEAEGEGDNRPVIAEVLRLRAEKARILGFETFAHWIADGQMAKTPDAAMALLRQVWLAAVARAREELAEMRAFAIADGVNDAIEAWDYRYYAEKLRQQIYDLSADELQPYLQLGKLCEGMFWAAGQLFGLAFTRLTDVAVPHPDVEVYAVTRGGVHVGLWYFDLFARPGKSSGAWMSEYRTQQKLAGVTPIISNNANFIPARPGAPVLLSWADAVTLFHEFGHGLHGLLSSVTYPSLAGLSVLRDFVELPSQLNERWLATPELLSRFALHVETGAPMPAALLEKVLRAQTFRQGFDTVEYVACAILDLEAHLAADAAFDASAFEAEALARLGMPGEILLRHRLPHFAHTFGGEGYAAGYYSYLWADTLSADAAEAFAEAPGGLYDPSLAQRLLDEVLSVGNSIEPAEAYRRFRGRDATTDALMRRRGFAVVAQGAEGT